MTLMLSLLTAAAAVLLFGAASVYRRGDRQRALLMAIAAMVLIGNVAIWLVPLG